MMHIFVAGADDTGTGSLVADLRRNGCRVDRAETGRAALSAPTQADLLLLDLELPDLDGVNVCRNIRSGSDIPIISITSRHDEADRVLALQAGADDCLVKPFGFRELMARIEAVLRRARPSMPVVQMLAHGPLTLDTASREVRLDGRLISLTRKEFDFLRLLVSQPAAVLSRKEALSRVWGYPWPSRSRTIDVHVSSLRKKLGDASWILTVHGVGFRLGPAAGRRATGPTAMAHPLPHERPDPVTRLRATAGGPAGRHRRGLVRRCTT